MYTHSTRGDGWFELSEMLGTIVAIPYEFVSSLGIKDMNGYVVYSILGAAIFASLAIVLLLIWRLILWAYRKAPKNAWSSKHP